MKATKYNLPQVAKLLGVDRDKIRHASIYKQVVKAQRVGCSLLYTKQQVETLRAYFALSEHERRHYSPAVEQYAATEANHHAEDNKPSSSRPCGDCLSEGIGVGR